VLENLACEIPAQVEAAQRALTLQDKDYFMKENLHNKALKAHQDRLATLQQQLGKRELFT